MELKGKKVEKACRGMYKCFFNHSVAGEGVYALGEEEKRFILSIPMYSCSFFLTLLFYFSP